MNKIFFTLLFLVSSFGTFAQFRSGLILGGGKGYLRDLEYLPKFSDNGGQGKYEYKFDMAIGYKFRIQPTSKRYFYDIDAYLGIKRFNYYGYTPPIGDYWSLIQEGKASEYVPEVIYYSAKAYQYHASLNTSWNYKIIKGLYAGAGAEPTFYYIDEDPNHYKFDLPLTGKIGYNLKYVDVAFSYKFGLFNSLTPDDFSSGKFSNWQIQLFIPF